jgi:hypothetical protein
VYLGQVVPIALINGPQRIRNLALIDSGADYCIFHSEIGEQIGLDIESGKRLSFFGTGGQEQSAFFHAIKLEVGGHAISCFAGFSQELQSLPYGILGQIGFFDKFKITFDYEKGKIELQAVED